MLKLRSILLFCMIIMLSCNQRFNSDDWKANKDRDKQINSLIKSKILIGKSYEEVIALLGKEYKYSKYTDSLSNNSKFSIQYLTGATQWIDFERLKIIFESSKVVSAYKYYD